MPTTHKQDWTVADMLAYCHKDMIKTYESINEKIDLILSGEYAVLTSENLKLIQSVLKDQITDLEKRLAE